MSNLLVTPKVHLAFGTCSKLRGLYAQYTLLLSLLVCLCSIGFSKIATADTFSLEQAVQLAIQHDPLLKGNAYREQGFKADADAASYWSNPQMSVSMQNLPTDGFAIDQEPMSQIKVGFKQQLPRGDENHYSQKKYQVMASKVVVENQARTAWVKRDVTLAWLNWFHATRRIALLEKEKALLTQLLDFTESSYSQGVGSTSQQDILEVRLALLSLDDKYVQAYQQRDEAKAAFAQWYGAPLDEHLSAPEQLNVAAVLRESNISLSSFIAFIDTSEPFLLLQHHPEAKLFQFRTQVEKQNLNIAREQTKPQWTLEASYGYRKDDPSGASRADFVSLGVQVDLPFFNTPRQDASISSAAFKVSASETDFRLKVNELAAKANVLQRRLSALSERKALYETVLIGETQQLSEAELSAYTADTADINDVVNANLKLVKVQDERLKIDVERAKTLANLAYLYLPSRAYTLNKE